MRWGGLVGLACVLSACGGAEAFACAEDSECQLGGQPGVCVAGSCAYPDPACPSGYRFPASLGGGCAVGDGLGGTDSEASTSTMSTMSTMSPTTSSTTDGSEEAGPSTTQPLESTSGVASSTSGADDTGPVGTTIETTDATSTTDPPPDCGEQSCSQCASCVTEPGGDCREQAEACFELDGCSAATDCMIACSVDDICDENCCLGLADDAIHALFELHACSAEACVPACDFFEDLQCT